MLETRTFQPTSTGLINPDLKSAAEVISNLYSLELNNFLVGLRPKTIPTKFPTGPWKRLAVNNPSFTAEITAVGRIFSAANAARLSNVVPEADQLRTYLDVVDDPIARFMLEDILRARINIAAQAKNPISHVYEAHLILQEVGLNQGILTHRGTDYVYPFSIAASVLEGSLRTTPQTRVSELLEKY